MKKELNILYISATLIATLAMTNACTQEDNELTENNLNAAFGLAANLDSYTRAASENVNRFEIGTLYQLYAIANGDWQKNILTSDQSMNYVRGTEAAGNVIEYTGNNKFDDNTLDFYAVTTSSKDETLEFGTDSQGIPTYTVTYTGNSGLKDVMYSNNLKSMTYKNSGKLTMKFGHTLSKLNFFAQKSPDQTSAVTITEIKVIDYSTGTLSLANGEFTDSQSTRQQSNNEDQTYSVLNKDITVKEVASKTPFTEVMVFPTRGMNEKTHSLGIQVTTRLGNSSTTNTNTYWVRELDLTQSTNEKPVYNAFQFKPNYEYDIALTLTGTTMVVTVLPRVYDWIDDDSEYADTGVGNSVTFGGVTWMDRNIGATSADATKSAQDWEKSRGFYYQFGRSIPYYLDGSVLDPDGNTNSAPYCKDDDKDNNARPFPYVPGFFNVNQACNIIGYSDCAQDPGNTGKDFAFKYNHRDGEDYFTKYYRDWASDHTVSANYWNSIPNQPCPKGWRLPTKDEFLSIMPGSALAGDIAFKTNSWNLPNNSGDQSHMDGAYQVEVLSDINGERAQYVGIKTPGLSWGTIYAIKMQGTNKAYRLKWDIKLLDSECNPNGTKAQKKRSVLVISRYPASSKDEITESNYNKKYTDWDSPVEVLMLPISGYIHSDITSASLIYAGSEAIYWTSTANTEQNTAYSARIKFSGDNTYKNLFMWGDERRGYGCSVRCVRDKNVKD